MKVEMKVVHCKRDPFDIYIGRRKDGLGIWGNPFRIGDYHEGKLITRELSLELYEIYIRDKLNKDRKLRDLLVSMINSRLGCWCAPKACHGDILKKLCQELIDNYGTLRQN